MKKYYYLDENGNRKEYVGKIINDCVTGETLGLLTQQIKSQKEVELEYHPQIDEQPGWNSYFTYIDSSGNNIKVIDSNVRKNYKDNSYFITNVNEIKIDLKKHNKIDYQPGYFTYTSPLGKEIKYDGEYFYDKLTNSYYFYK